MSVEEVVKSIVKNIAGVDEVSLGYNLRSDLGLDSLDMLDLFMDIEDVLDIQIDHKKAEGVVTVQDIVDLIRGN